MRDPRRNPVPARYRYSQRSASVGARSRVRLWAVLAGGAAVLAVGAVGVFIWTLGGSPEVDADERAAAESFARSVLEMERRRASVVAEFEQVGVEMRTTEFEAVYGVLDSVILQQERLILDVQSIDSPSNATALAHTLLEDSYEDELEGYRLLRVVVGLAEAVFPGGTPRRARRMDGYQAAVSRLTRAEYSRGRAYEELEDLLARVGLSLEEVRRMDGGEPVGRRSPAGAETEREGASIPALERSLTAEETADAARFAGRMLDLEVKQRQIIRDYRMYEIDLLTRWIGDSFAGAQALLERQRNLLREVRSVDAPEAEGAGGVRALYEESFEEGLWAFEDVVAALEPLNEAGVSVAFGIRSGMLSHSGASDGLSRSAMSRLAARAELESLAASAGTTLEDIERTRVGSAGGI